MRSFALGTGSGCLVWFLVFSILFLCLCPVAASIGGVSSTVMGDSVAGIIGPLICPESSTAEIIRFLTTMRDEFGNESPATGYEMQCVDESGNIVRDPSPDYAFYWVGILSFGAVAVSALLALLLAAPVAGIIARYSSKRKASKASAGPDVA